MVAKSPPHPLRLNAIGNSVLKIRAFLLLLALVVCAPVWAKQEPPPSPSPGVGGGKGWGAAIATAHPLATSAGREILKKGGNAFDAAVAVSAALAVVEPYSSGLGGGGFWLLHRAQNGFEVMLDGREMAPLKATADMYLDQSGKPIPKASLQGAKAAAIPGTPAALVWLARKYGRLPLKTSLAPAIRYAKQGFSVDERYLRMAQTHEALLRENAAAARVFLRDGGVPYPGYRLRQPDLAVTLQALARHGKSGFYSGAVARAMLASVKAGGGIWEMDDLKNYRVVEREPVKFSYHGAQISSAALPSSGGLTLAQSLNILEALPFAQAQPHDRAHFVIEALRRAYQDRARYLGDPDFFTGPWEKLASKPYAALRAASIEPSRATPSENLSQAADGKEQGGSTTHFSIVDREGNRVAATLSINTPFGSGFVAGNTGVLLNNEMDDFSISPGTPNVYGLVGSAANAIAPGKRPLSSMTPTFVEDDKGILILGTPGGSRIISMVLLAILDHLHRAQPDIQSILSAPRYHHQFLPDRVEIEPERFSREWISELERKGHKVHVAKLRWGNMQAVFVDKATRRATTASNLRGAGLTWY